MRQHDRFVVRNRRHSSVPLDLTQPTACLLLFLVAAAHLLGNSSAVEPDRPSSSLSAIRSAKGGLTGISPVTPRHLPRQDDRRDDRRHSSSMVSADDHTTRPTSSPGHQQPTSEFNSRHSAWAETAYTLIQRVDCSGRGGGGSGGSGVTRLSVPFASTSRECLDVQRLRRDQLNVYIAGPSSRGGRLKTILPDGPIESVLASEVSSGPSGAHDGVVAIDPYPEANFGHLVIVFHVTSGVTDAWCKRRDGIVVVDNSECMTLAAKNRCRNAVAPRNHRRNFDRRCEINFIPMVTLDELQPSTSNSSTGGRQPRLHQHREVVEENFDSGFESRQHRHLHRHHHDDRQLLTCRTDLPGFSTACPSLRPRNSTAGLVWCNPLRENSKRCETPREALMPHRSSASSTSTSNAACRVFEICDQAIVISGGWNRWTHRQHHANNVARFYSMLRENGFRSGNIKVFFANGSPDIPPYDAASQADMFPAAQKMVIRYHIQNLCQSLHCVDSLVIYLNSPTTSDGTVLLWDVDQDGIASDSERYTVAELKSDLSGCQARHVHLVVDQSYAGETARALRRARGLDLRHIGVYASGKDNEYSYEDEFSSAWTRLNHTRMCVKDVFREARRYARSSHPQMQLGDDTAGNVNLFGAPCNFQPPFSYDELRQNYLGCQNLPTALWVKKLKDSSSSLSASSSSTSGRHRSRHQVDQFDLMIGV